MQLFSAGRGAQLPAALSISDKPSVAYRGLEVDAARVPISLHFHLDTIKRLSGLKMSAYHIHLSDDDGYSLPSQLFPNLTSHRLALI